MGKLLLIGSTGAVGQAVARKALSQSQSNEITIFVRDRSKLEKLLPTDLLDKAQVAEGDVQDLPALAAVMQGHEACICTAGNARTAPEEYKRIFKGVVDTAAANLAHPRRLWVMAGVTVTEVPGAKGGLTLNDLPIFSWLPYKIHSANFEHLQAAGSELDWTLMCPGPLHTGSDSKAPAVFKEQAPIWVPWPTVVPQLLLSLAILLQMGRFGVSLDAVAGFVVANLEAGGEFSRKRVGLVKA